jgi:hypothetical protein
VDEERLVVAGEDVEEGCAEVPAGRVQQGGGGELKPHAAAPEFAFDGFRGRVRCRQAGRGPDAEGGREREGAVVEGGEQRGGLGGRQVFDAERAGEGDQGEVQAVGVGECGAGRDVVVGRVDLVRRLARQVQGPAVEVRRCGAGAQLLDEGGRPDVLVDVGGHAAVLAGCTEVKRFTDAINLSG